jgi:nucleoside-diphosphate-sugar epimerase
MAPGDGVEAAKSLKILVYGATGKIGSHVVDEALNRGHLVTAVSRHPSSITQQHENLSAVAGDLLDSGSIATLVNGQDVVIISVRGIIGKSKTPESALQRIAVEKVVNVLRDIGCDAPRLIHAKKAGAGNSGAGAGVAIPANGDRCEVELCNTTEKFHQRQAYRYLSDRWRPIA